MIGIGDLKHNRYKEIVLILDIIMNWLGYCRQGNLFLGHYDSGP